MTIEKQTIKYFIIAMLAFSLIFIVAGDCLFLYYLHKPQKVLPYSLGVLFGYIGACLRILLMHRGIVKSLDMRPENAQNYAQLQVFFRTMVAGVFIAVSVFTPFLNIFGTALGLISMQPAAYVVGHIVRKDSTSSDSTRKESE